MENINNVQVTVVIPFAYCSKWLQTMLSSLKEHKTNLKFTVMVMNNAPHHPGIKAVTKTTLNENVSIHVPPLGQRGHGGALDHALEFVETPYLFTTEPDCRVMSDCWLDWFINFMHDQNVIMAGSIQPRGWIDASMTLYNTKLLRFLQKCCQGNQDTINCYGNEYEKRDPLPSWMIDLIKRRLWGPFEEFRGFHHNYHIFPIQYLPDKHWHEPGHWIFNRASCQWECVQVESGLQLEEIENAPAVSYSYCGAKANQVIRHYHHGSISHSFEEGPIVQPQIFEWYKFLLTREHDVWIKTVPEPIRKLSLEKGYVRTLESDLALAKERIKQCP